MSASVMAQDKAYISIGEGGTALDITAIPVALHLENAKENVRGIECAVILPGLEGKTKADIEAMDLITKKGKNYQITWNDDRCPDGAGGGYASQIKILSEEGKAGKIYWAVYNPSDVFYGNSGELCHFTYNASYLKDNPGKYIIKFTNQLDYNPSISYDDGTPTLEFEGNEDVSFTIDADGNVASVGRIIAEDPTSAQKGIYNVQGMKIRQTVPGRLYIINGKKVIANEVISAE